jgi:integrase
MGRKLTRTWSLAIIHRRVEEIVLDTLFPPNRIAGGEFMTWSSRFVRELKAKTEGVLEAPMPPWTVHNLRHTIGTHMREDLGISSEVVSLLLGHTPPGPRVTRVYNRRSYCRNGVRPCSSGAAGLTGRKRMASVDPGPAA